MPMLERLKQIGLVPVAVIEDAGHAAPAAKALMAGGIGAMEITLRTAAGLDCIREACHACPDMIVGAGTVLSVEQARESAEAGAQFIVSPGFDADIVGWCLANDIAVIPGCVTPSEIMAARNMGLRTVKFFPANIYGGVAALSALAAPFADMSFVPTGGIGPKDIADYADKQFVAAIGGGWLCGKADVSAGRFDKIQELAREAVGLLLSFEIAHLGINAESEEEASKIVGLFGSALGLPLKNGNTSLFAGTAVEVNKSPGRGAMGHVGIWTNSVERAIYYIEKRGYRVDGSCLKNGRKTAVYLNDEFGGFAVHLLQK